MSSVRCMPPVISAAKAAVAMSSAFARAVVSPSFSAGVFLNSTEYSLRVRSIPGIGLMLMPAAFAAVIKTPLLATTIIESAPAASSTNSFSPVSFPPATDTCASAGFQLALASSIATVARASPRQMGARYFFFWPEEATASSTAPASTTLEKNGPGRSARPASSISRTSSTLPRPTPPYSSGKIIPV